MTITLLVLETDTMMPFSRSNMCGLILHRHLHQHKELLPTPRRPQSQQQPPLRQLAQTLLGLSSQARARSLKCKPTTHPPWPPRNGGTSVSGSSLQRFQRRCFLRFRVHFSTHLRFTRNAWTFYIYDANILSFYGGPLAYAHTDCRFYPSFLPRTGLKDTV